MPVELREQELAISAEGEFMGDVSWTREALAIDGNTAFNRAEQRYTTANVLKGGECALVSNEVIYSYDGYTYRDEITNENGETIVRYVNPDDASDLREVPYEEAYVDFTLRSTP